MKHFKSLVSKHFAQGATLGEVLTKLSQLNDSVLHEAAQKGAVWVQKKQGKILRERHLERKLGPQDTVSLFYDPKILTLPALENLQCLVENDQYGVWPKPAGVVPQGSQAGDHASLLRFIELKKQREVYLIHRLDRETMGVMIFAYTAVAASKLSDLFQKNLIRKEYEAVVLGEIEKGAKGTIDVSLDDKKAITHYEVLESSFGRSLLKIHIETGRLHQIRRHLYHIGHPVLGDPKYGRGNKNKEGLRLLAKSLSFHDPWINKSVTYIFADVNFSNCLNFGETKT
jgi:tRNA pseudouridine32 synthase / 23S rRNA pseudouridine746 synthase